MVSPTFAKVVVIADSLALPRPEDLEEVLYEETYPFLLEVGLRNKFGAAAPVVMEKGERARTITKAIRDWTEFVTWRKPEVVIIQVGVADCAPRVFHAWQTALIDWLNGLPAVRIVPRLLLAVVNKNRRRIIKMFPRKVYTSRARFEKVACQLIRWAERDHVRNLIFINIISPPDYIEARSPGFQKNVREYNEILEKLATESSRVQVVDINGLIHGGRDAERFLLKDGIHLNAEGNRLLAGQLETIVSSVLE